MMDYEIAGEQDQKTSGTGNWRKAIFLPPDVFELLQKSNRAINPITIIATVDPNGKPHTAPFGSLRAVDPKRLRMACDRNNATYANLIRDGQVSVAVLAPPTIAVSIRGQVRMIKSEMDISKNLSIFEIDIAEVKNNMMQRGRITSMIEFEPPDEYKEYYVGAIAEIEDLVDG